MAIALVVDAQTSLCTNLNVDELFPALADKPQPELVGDVEVQIEKDS